MLRVIGKANETKIKIDNVGCLGLVDSGAELSDIAVDFIQQLKLPIYKLDQFIKPEATGVGDILYKGYVKVSLKIPEIKSFNGNVLMLVLHEFQYN